MSSFSENNHDDLVTRLKNICPEVFADGKFDATKADKLINSSLRKKQQESKEYIFAYAAQLDKERSDSTLKSIENERNKAGILLGFFFLMTPNGVEYFVHLNPCLKIACVLLSLLLITLLTYCFTGIKMPACIDTTNTFLTDWNKKENPKEVLLRDIHNEWLSIAKQQAMVASRLSKFILCSVICLILIGLIIFINYNFL